VARGFHPHRHLRKEFLQHDIFVDADYGMIGTRHSHIGLVRGSVGQDARVRGGDVRVRAHHRRDAAVQVPAHRHLFAGQLGMKIDESDFDLLRQLFENLVRFAKRAIGLRHVGAALQVDNRAIDAVAGLHGHDAAAGQIVDVVGGTKQSRLAFEIVVNFALVPDMIATGQDVQAVAEQFVGKLRGDAESARRIFAVGDAQVDFFGSDDVFQVPGDKASPRRGEDVANKQEIGQTGILSKERTTMPS
jgi:hypothetical protein